jgi:hypothetical protein
MMMNAICPVCYHPLFALPDRAAYVCGDLSCSFDRTVSRIELLSRQAQSGEFAPPYLTDEEAITRGVHTGFTRTQYREGCR